MNENPNSGAPPPPFSPGDQPPDGRTVPLGKDGVPTTTVTRRPWTVLVTLGISALCAIALGVVHAFGNYTTAETTLDKLVSTLQAGDVDTLLEDPELGFRERAERDIRQRGLEEYNQILAAFSNCEAAGLDRYRKLEQTVILQGEEAFKKLPGDKQRSIRHASRQAWILENGLAGLSEEERRGIDDPDVFSDPGKARPHLLRLGLEEMAEQGEEDLPTAEEIAGWGKKPSKNQASLLARIMSEGADEIEDVRKDASSLGTKKFKGLTPRERRSIASASYDLWVVENGIERLDDTDRLLVSGPEMFLDDADEEIEARRLCMLVLPPAQKALLEGRVYEDFTAKREDYIKQTGRERYVRFLEALFGSCEYEVESSTLSGDDPHDLLRISTATFEIRWKDCPGAEEYIGTVLTFRFDGRSWRFDPDRAEAAPEQSASVLPEPPEGNDPGGGS